MSRIVFSENFAINLFMMVSMTFLLGSGYIASLPSRFAASIRHGANWREVANLTALEKYEAAIAKDYSEFLDSTPFHMYPYLSKIKGLWSTIWNSDESWCTKFTSLPGAFLSTVSLSLNAAVCAPIRAMYTQNGVYIEEDKVSILIHDPNDEIVSSEIEIKGKKHKIEVINQTLDKHKLVFVPRYRPFTEICKSLAVESENAKLLEIGGQPKVTVDVLYRDGEDTLNVDGAKLIYEMDRLQDPEKRRYATYEIDVANLQAFEKAVGIGKIEYVHE